MGKGKPGEELRKESVSSAAERPRGESPSEGGRVANLELFPKCGVRRWVPGRGGSVGQWKEQALRVPCCLSHKIEIMILFLELLGKSEITHTKYVAHSSHHWYNSIFLLK